MVQKYVYFANWQNYFLQFVNLSYLYALNGVGTSRVGGVLNNIVRAF